MRGAHGLTFHNPVREGLPTVRTESFFPSGNSLAVSEGVSSEVSSTVHQENSRITSARDISLLRSVLAAVCRRCWTGPRAFRNRYGPFPGRRNVARLSRRRRIRDTDCAPIAKRLRTLSGPGPAHWPQAAGPRVVRAWATGDFPWLRAFHFCPQGLPQSS